MTDEITLTEEKKKALLEELNHLKTTRRKEILEVLNYAKSLGDLSENAEYHQAREDQGKLEDRINQIDYMLQSAVFVKKRHSNIVEIGSSVTIKKEGEKEPVVYHIVGTEEADMPAKKISNNSPLGAALFGKSEGDAITLTTP